MLLEYVLPKLNERTLTSLAIAIPVILLVILVARPALLPEKANQLLSKAIHVFCFLSLL